MVKIYNLWWVSYCCRLPKQRKHTVPCSTSLLSYIWFILSCFSPWTLLWFLFHCYRVHPGLMLVQYSKSAISFWRRLTIYVAWFMLMMYVTWYTFKLCRILSRFWPFILPCFSDWFFQLVSSIFSLMLAQFMSELWKSEVEKWVFWYVYTVTITV